MRTKATLFINFILMMSITLIAFGQGQPTPLFEANQITIVPEIFLRGYDPITVFFPQNTGPMNGGPADDPGVGEHLRVGKLSSLSLCRSGHSTRLHIS